MALSRRLHEPAKLSDEMARRLATAWLEHAGYNRDDTNIVGELLLDVVLGDGVPMRIQRAVFDVTGIDIGG